jgi:preprotein translocase subunit SecD
MLGLVAVVLVALYLGLFLGPSATPKLGLDLRGGTQVILHATDVQGGEVSKSALNSAVDIIRQRVDAAGVGGATINTQGSDNIVVSAPGVNGRQLDALDQTALLNFRQVLAQTSGSAGPAATPPTTSATPSTSAEPSKSPDKKKKSSGAALTSALMRPGASASPSPSPSATTPTASPSPSAADTGATEPVPGSYDTNIDVVSKVYESYDCVNGVNENSPTLGADAPEDYIVACDDTGAVKYLLAPAGVKGEDIGSANSTVDPQTNQWKVQLTFKGDGKGGWFDLTKKAYESTPLEQCPPQPDQAGCNGIAITLDGVVQSAPASQAPGIAGGSTEITGDFSRTEADTLANVLKFGALPLKLEKISVNTVSATLGSDQLRGGLIAGVIGLGLVILYSLLYYRALGIVTVLSLAVSGLLLYSVTTLLGHSSLGYTLSLPGIAGFIVAVGITADSFVVFFERLRDEVREGKRLRSAVERAWPRARRTIISADAVSLLAAVVLYIVSIGDVRGFAFTLGLSTIADLFVVFCFTKPLLAVLARTKTFDAGHGWTGVGGTKHSASFETKPKEA